jgi:DNA-binding transcriptional regulator YbjK
MTQIAPTKTARGVSARPAVVSAARTTVASVVGGALFGRIVGRVDRVAVLAFFVFFAGTDILLSESFWSFRSAESS